MLNNMEDEIIGSLSMEFEVMQVDLNIVECIMIMMIWILIQFLGNGLLLGLIQYDRLGGDPLKRRISDQVSNFSILDHLVYYIDQIISLVIVIYYTKYPTYYN